MAAAAVVSSPSISRPAAMPSRASQPSSSRSKQPSTSTVVSPNESSTSKPFSRIRSSLEQSIRSATRSRKTPALGADDFGTITPSTSTAASKGKDRAISEDSTNEKKQSNSGGMLRRLESKVNFRRYGRESESPIPPATSASGNKPGERDKARVAGKTSYVTPSLRMGSMSSPALHLSSQALPSPKSRPSIPISSSNSNAALVSPTRDRSKRSSLQPPASSAHAETRHRPTRSQPVNIPPASASTATLHAPTYGDLSSQYSDLPPSPPDTPTPPSGSRYDDSPSSPIRSRGGSPVPVRTRSRVVSPTSHRGLTSSSTSNLSSPGPPSPRRPSFDATRRPSVEIPRRVSGEQARRPSLDTARRPSGARSPSLSRDESPIPGARPRPTSPNQRSYAQNRHFNLSTASLTPQSSPEQREVIRLASSLLCKETLKPPPHMSRTEAGLRDWEEVEVRMRSLARLERIWGKSGAASASTASISGPGTTSSGISAGGEERERKLFCEALRDGFVLCQLLNKVRATNAVRPDPREDGFVRTSNVTKFLAGCSSYGLADEELFLRDDILEATPESLARVASTIIALVKFAESGVPDRSRIISGQGKKASAGPYSSSSRAQGVTSSPNLVTPAPPRALSPTSPRKISGLSASRPEKLVDPPESPNPDVYEPERRRIRIDDKRDSPLSISPPPKSPLRSRASGKQPLSVSPSKDDGADLFTYSSRQPSSPSRDPFDGPNASTIRQSVASTMTDSTTTTAFSSLLEVGRKTSSVFNKFGTIRTMTTEATSESPSMTRTEGSAVAEDLRKRADSSTRQALDRKMSNNTSIVDLTRVIEEAEDSASNGSHGGGRAEQKKSPSRPEKNPAIRLGKGKWPDDFMDVLQPRPSNTLLDMEEPTPNPSTLSSSPPRKLAIVTGGHRGSDSVESLTPFPRRPSYRSRQSNDAPAGLLPKDAVAPPDGLPGNTSRIMLRRNSTKTAARPGQLTSRTDTYDPGLSDLSTSSPVPVPFPRALSSEQAPRGSPEFSTDASDGKPKRPMRGRFQSDVQGSGRRPRPTSTDELGARSRIESMANIGAAGSASATASDIMARNGIEDSAIRKALIVREEGKLPTHFQLGNCIGRGQFGSVYRALNLNTGQMVAVKRIRLEGLREDEVTQLMREVDLVKSLSHPSIVKYEGMARDNDTLSIVLEYAENGSLGQTLKAFGKLNERLVASYVVKILEGLDYLHQCDVVHCDLKAANILTTKTGNVKLSDFGVSLNLRAMEREINDVAGTPNWMAPEVIELKGASTKSDIWSLGCTVIELLTGKPPYSDIANSMSVMFRIVEDDMPPIPSTATPLLTDFLHQCFNKEPSERPSAEDLCEHEWLKTNWMGAKELRAQDSIPFLRRVSADFHNQKSDAIRMLGQPESPNLEMFEPANASPRARRTSTTSMMGMPDNDIAPREHTFVKTSFSKPMICRVCLLSVKKSAVLCAQCSLISHAKCALNAPPTCDLRAQLLMYAQFAEKGNTSGNGYPLDGMSEQQRPKGPVSDVSYVAHSPRTSLDSPASPAPPSGAAVAHPPTAFKLTNALKLSRQNLTEPHASSSASATSLPQQSLSDAQSRKPQSKTALHRRPTGKKERPVSISSGSTRAGSSSLRSAAPTVNSQGRKSATSNNESPLEGVDEHSDEDSYISGGLSGDRRPHHKKGKSSSGNCIVQ